MTTYIFLYLVLAFITLLASNAPQKVKLFFCGVSILIIVLFQGLRWRTGTDWQPYYDAFMKPESARDYCETGYLFINQLVGSLFKNYSFFLLIQSTFGLFSIYRLSRFCGVNNISLVLLYAFACTIFPIRMATSVAVFAFAYPYILKRQLIKYLFVCSIAISIHSAAIVVLPSYFIVNRRFSDKIVIIAYISSCIVGLLSTMVFSGILDIAGLVYYNVSDLAQRKMEAYVVENQDVEGLSVLSYLNALLFILLFLYIRKKHFNDSRIYDMLLNMYVLGIIFNRVVSGAIPYLARTTAYFSAGFALMLLLWFEKLHVSRRFVFVIFFIFYSMYFYFLQVNKHADVFVPYYSVFSPTERPVVY